MEKYEYKMLSVMHSRAVDNEKQEATLNAYGKEGWELVSVQYPFPNKEKGEGTLTFFLKRPIQNLPVIG